MEGDRELGALAGGETLRGPINQTRANLQLGETEPRLVNYRAEVDVSLPGADSEDVEPTVGGAELAYFREAGFNPRVPERRDAGGRAMGPTQESDDFLYAGRNRPEGKEWKMAMFDGEEDWGSYYIQFQMMALHNNWSEQEQAMQLVRSLSGGARTILTDMTFTQLRSLSALVAAIERRYQPKEKMLAHRALFNIRRQNVKEEAAAYAEALRLLAVQAFSAMTTDNREGRIRDRFIEGLNDVELRKAIYLGHHETLESVVSAAIEWEALDEAMLLSGARKPRNLEKINVVQENMLCNDMVVSLQQLSNKVANLELKLKNPQGGAARNLQNSTVICSCCGKMGHFMRDCPGRTSSNRSCYECGQLGHIQAKCPRKVSSSPRPQVCSHCRQSSHFRRDCPQKWENSGN